jgi:hypothetical protein
MPTKTPYMRAGPDSTLIDHDDRIKNLERMRHESWHYVGEVDEPSFQNSWTNAGGTLAPLRFRRLVAGGVEIQGSVTGGTPGTLVFTLPTYYRPDHELRLAASDDAGDFLVFRVLADGSVIAGV